MRAARRLSLAAGMLAAALLPAAPSRAQGSEPDTDAATGYRVRNYRAPVNLPVRGGTRVGVAEVDRLRGEGAAMIDVMPQRGGYDPETGAWRIVDRRDTIPGAVWLPETGRGTIEPRLSAYLAAWLSRLSGGDPGRPLVFFCKADCWMSWNAVRRAAELGYRRVYWFAEGTDGWSEADRPLERASPPPVPLAADTRGERPAEPSDGP
ncbi:PQQ-dependent catabolism-associated CXXCW motif protein [Methylobacterium sp. BE186]|uniref:rhodanese-like domain-containing protein n=1 Tax=Methylobacterium sp. BE186 TaxID=2817715 RepID=UPI00285C9D29|nr:rhodanese-like domain-containing protein [Methylobacterium sp. BE186]MDR7038523.1 PQQ-dependent catabolism-associated CXXCW motif protein [Methylobacterium sp. BE186]